MASSSSASVASLSRDDFSLHFLIDRHNLDDTIVSDAKYAEELLLQEALMASLINPTTSPLSPPQNPPEPALNSPPPPSPSPSPSSSSSQKYPTTEIFSKIMENSSSPPSSSSSQKYPTTEIFSKIMENSSSSPSSSSSHKYPTTEIFSKIMENSSSASVASLSPNDFSLHFLIDPHHLDDTIVSDGKYAEELLVQEAIMASLINPTTSPHSPPQSPPEQALNSPSPSPSPSSPSSSSQFFCEICTETKQHDQTFQVHNCDHRFCRDCIAKHIASKIQKSPISVPGRENPQCLVCPGLDCEGVVELERCLDKVPREVLTSWGDYICESLIPASQKFYCPYRDCSALLVKDGDEMVRQSECPYCRRLFCAQCRVGWHSGVGCEEYCRLSEGEREREDLMVHELAKVKKWQRCPRCMFFVEKTDGCLHLTCRCGYEFCYGCGAKWRSNHHGTCQ